MMGHIFIVSAPCGAGKSSLVSAILEELQHDWQIHQVVTYTTRKPRQNERDGRDYNFIDIHDFERRIKDGFFLEWSNAYGSYYGSPQSILEDRKKGVSFILILDRAGAQQVVQKVPDAVCIWIEVSSIGLLRDRLLCRATETTVQIEKRLEQSTIEMALERHASFYHYKVVNDDFGSAKLQLMTIMLHMFQIRARSIEYKKKASCAS